MLRVCRHVIKRLIWDNGHMGNPSEGLVEFLKERLAEDEQWALAASQPYQYAEGNPSIPEAGVHWTWVVGDNWEPTTPDPSINEFVAEVGHSCNLATVETWPSTMGSRTHQMPRTYADSIVEMEAAAAGHIVCHDPARAVREVEAKRETIRLFEDTLATIEMLKSHDQKSDAHEVAAESYLNVIRRDAAVYADHSDYDETWRP